MRYDAMEEEFEEVTIFDKPALFTGVRLERSTIPQGYHVFEVRHDYDFQGHAVQIGRNILVNHWGSIITRDAIVLPRAGYLDIEPEAFNYGTGDCQSMAKFMAKYPPKTKQPRSYER